MPKIKTPKLQMVDLQAQYKRLKTDIDREIREVLQSARFIGGPKVEAFAQNLAAYNGSRHCIPCANGTDALQIAFMALGLEAGDEVIVPAFTYVATAEVLALLGLRPVMVDVDAGTFNLRADLVEKAITSRTKAIVPVHLFGQSVDMQPLMDLAKKHGLFVVEDNAQAIGADYRFSDGSQQKTGSIGHIGSTSFFPSKNLGCYGDGGAMFTNDDELASRLRRIANHGQDQLYFHAEIGVNSRLDALQAGILNVKLRHLDAFCAARQQVAAQYDAAFSALPSVQIPARQNNSTHVFHQYTLLIKNGRRDDLKKYLAENGIPAMIYYPLPLYRQPAFAHFHQNGPLETTETLCQEVISLPMHTELTAEDIRFISDTLASFFVN